MKVLTELNAPAQYDKSPGYNVLTLITEFDGELKFLYALFYQLPELPENHADRRIDKVYVSKFDKVRSLVLVMPKLHPFSSDDADKSLKINKSKK
ncbi:MAG: hypothetical protein Q8O13_00350 [Candidatus Omnitrophota bacterium]|nr:hypothetical protein [Candidatus Omnitrophota bacterium]